MEHLKASNKLAEIENPCEACEDNPTSVWPVGSYLHAIMGPAFVERENLSQSQQLSPLAAEPTANYNWQQQL